MMEENIISRNTGNRYYKIYILLCASPILVGSYPNLQLRMHGKTAMTSQMPVGCLELFYPTVSELATIVDGIRCLIKLLFSILFNPIRWADEQAKMLTMSSLRQKLSRRVMSLIFHSPSEKIYVSYPHWVDAPARILKFVLL